MKAADQNILDPLPDKMVKFDLDVISKVIEVKIEVKLQNGHYMPKEAYFGITLWDQPGNPP